MCRLKPYDGGLTRLIRVSNSHKYPLHKALTQCRASFTWQIFTKFLPEKCDLNLCKGFFIEKNCPKLARIQKEKSKSPDFKVAKNIK